MVEKNALYTAARFIIYFCVSPCDESGLKQVQRNPFPPCALGGVTGVLHTRLPNPRRPPRSHHCGTRRENKAKTKARRRNKSYADIRALLGQPSRRACDNAKRGTQFVSRLPRTVVVSFSLLPPPPFSPSFFRYRKRREKFGNFLRLFSTRIHLPHEEKGTDRLLLLLLLHTYATEQCNWRNRVSGGK